LASITCSVATDIAPFGLLLMSEHTSTIRDSLHDRITLDGASVRLIGTAPFLRLDRIQQLGFVSKVWPGAKHTRFEHSLGVYHLMRQAIQALRVAAPDVRISARSVMTAQAAALLHDIGHYPFSHAIEELGDPVLPHEAIARQVISTSPVADVLEKDWRVSPHDVIEMIDPQGELPEELRLLRGLLSGPLDVDKLDYLPRDAKACNVPYGGVDTPRLLDSLRIAMVDGAPRIVVNEKGVSPLHSLINARQEMFDNVYWHHTNRACMAMLLRAVQEALIAGAIKPLELTRLDDASLIARFQQEDMPAETRMLVDSLEARVIHKRAVEISARAGDLYHYLGGLFYIPAARRRLERSMTRELASQLQTEVGDHEVLIDLPKPEKWKTDVWVLFDRPPVGFRTLMPWIDVVGLGDDDFKRYEEHRRMIRIVATERLREEVANRWESLLLPMMALSRNQE
jgi:uncharacterized protein